MHGDAGLFKSCQPFSLYKSKFVRGQREELVLQSCSKLGDLVSVKVGLHGNRGKEFADAELFKAW